MKHDKTTAIAEPPATKAAEPVRPIFFGCANGHVGHYAFDNADGWALSELAEWLTRHDAKLAPPTDPSEIEGAARIVQVRDENFTVLAFWDRSVDHRHGSNAMFLLPGLLEFDAAIDAARAAFPRIWPRFTFPITNHGAAIILPRRS